jgi:hypothetical protein
MRKIYQQKSDRKIQFLFFILILCAKVLGLKLFWMHFVALFHHIQTRILRFTSIIPTSNFYKNSALLISALFANFKTKRG